MKYQLGAAKPVAKKAPFDVNAAIESLTAQLDKISSSYESLAAAEGRVAEVETVIADCQSAMESISKFGLTAQNMTLLNGADHGLDRALGLEDLAVESLASLSESTKALLKKQYTAGLEGKASEMFKNLVERVKAFFAKLIQWLKDLFTGNAQITKIVQEIAKNGINELDGEKSVTAISKSNVEEGFKGLENAINALKGLEGNPEAAIKASNDVVQVDLVKETKTVKELGWDAGSLKAVATKFAALATKADVAKIWNDIQAQYKSLIGDESKAKELQAAFQGWNAARKFTGVYSKLIRQIGLTIVTVSKASKKAPEPAAAK